MTPIAYLGTSRVDYSWNASVAVDISYKDDLSVTLNYTYSLRVGRCRRPVISSPLFSLSVPSIHSNHRAHAVAINRSSERPSKFYNVLLSDAVDKLALLLPNVTIQILREPAAPLRSLSLSIVCRSWRSVALDPASVRINDCEENPYARLTT